MMAPKSPGNRRRRSYQRSGFYTAKRAVVKYGARVLPGADTPIGRELRDWRLALIGDLGGPETLSTQQLALIDQAVVQRYLVSSLDGYVLSLPSLVNRTKRCAFTILRDRTAQVNLLRDLLRDLGLERRATDADGDVVARLAAMQHAASPQSDRPRGEKRPTPPDGAAVPPARREDAPAAASAASSLPAIARCDPT